MQWRLPLLLAIVCSVAACGGNRRLGGGGGELDLSLDPVSADFSPPESTDLASVYVPDPVDAGPDGMGLCVPPLMAAVCANPVAVDAGCGTVERCGSAATGFSGNGLDDNCNGEVDEGCTCVPGTVQRCFLGPPGKRNVGSCADGNQTCVGGEFGNYWGPCEGGVRPRGESCDGADNDCNGCPDDGLCCSGVLNCPAPGDPRIAPVQPFTAVPIMGSSFYADANATNWRWTVEGGPCDQLFSTTTGSPPKQSFTVTNGNTANPTFRFTLSGDYTVTFVVRGSDGIDHSCSWVQRVAGPGIRFELCWDKSGTVDIDLHVHKPESTLPWFTDTGNRDDCFYTNCKANSGAATRPNWGYSLSPLAECVGGPAGSTWQSSFNGCANPRLDVDNLGTSSQRGVPENTNIDRPKNHDTFRAMAHYWASTGGEVKPIVNVYCAGALKATFGRAPNTLGPCPGPQCFNTGGGTGRGHMWRVADVEALTDAGGTTIDCNVTPLHAPGQTSGYWVTLNDTSY